MTSNQRAQASGIGGENLTLLDGLIEGASGSAPVTTLLRKVKVVASRADVPALDEWVEHELGGYPEGVEVPEYRGPFAVEVLGTFGGPFGSGMSNAPVPSIGFPAAYREGSLFNILFTQPIAELEELSRGDDDLRAPWPANVIAQTNAMMMQGQVNLYEGLGLQQAWRVVTRAQLISIVDAVRTRILDLALTMERANPATGQAGAPPLPADAKQTIVTNVFGGNPNIAVASTGFSQSVEIEAGDRDALEQQLAALGVPQREIDALFTAITADEGIDSDGLGPATSSWLARIMMRAQELGIGTAGGLIANAISRYMGLT
jgi:hypothetical protein